MVGRRTKLLSLAALLALAMVGVAPEALAEGQTSRATPAPHASTMPRAVAGGAVLFGASYGLALYVPVRNDFEGDSDWLAVPLAGPMLAIAHGVDDVNYWALALDQVAQLAGAALIVAGSVEWASRSHSVAVWFSPQRREVALQLRY